MEEKKYDVIAFTDKGFSLDVRVDPDEDTVWLTKGQMAMLFDRDRSVISRHIKSIYNEGELSEKKYLCIFYTRTFNPKKIIRIDNVQSRCHHLRGLPREIWPRDLVQEMGFIDPQTISAQRVRCGREKAFGP